MLIRKAVFKDVASINDIYNSAVLKGYTAHTIPITQADRFIWFHKHDNNAYPIFVAELAGQIIGWLSLSAYRPGRQALKHTAEISYYIAEEYRNQGIGTRLVKEALHEAPLYGFTNLISIILENNTGSIRLIEKAGFKKWGFLPEVANINGRLCGHLYYGLKYFTQPNGISCCF